MRLVWVLAGSVAIFALYVWAEPLIREPDRATTESVVGAEVRLRGYRSTSLAGRARKLWTDVSRLRFLMPPPEQVVPRPPPPAAQWTYDLDVPDGYAPSAPFECVDERDEYPPREVLDCYATIEGLEYRVLVFEGDGSVYVTIPQS